MIAALVSLEFLDRPLYGILIPLSALLLALIVREKAPTLIHLAFVGFTTANVPGLFPSFAGGLLLGVIGPVVYRSGFRPDLLGLSDARAGRLGSAAADVAGGRPV